MTSMYFNGIFVIIIIVTEIYQLNIGSKITNIHQVMGLMTLSSIICICLIAMIGALMRNVIDLKKRIEVLENWKRVNDITKKI